MQTTNAEKDRKIKELQNEQNRLLGILAQREGGSSVLSIQDYKEGSSFKFEQHDDERFSTFSSNSMALHQQNGNTSRGGGGFFNFKRGGFGENILIGFFQ